MDAKLMKKFETLEEELKGLYGEQEHPPHVILAAGRIILDLYDEWMYIERLSKPDAYAVLREYDERLMKVYNLL